jgi:hypothetical protein
MMARKGIRPRISGWPEADSDGEKRFPSRKRIQGADRGNLEKQRWPKAEMEMVACLIRDGEEGAEMVGKEQRWWPGLEQII